MCLRGLKIPPLLGADLIIKDRSEQLNRTNEKAESSRKSAKLKRGYIFVFMVIESGDGSTYIPSFAVFVQKLLTRCSVSNVFSVYLCISNFSEKYLCNMQ